MSLPTSRERSYVFGMPVLPDDLNAIQDAITDSKHALRTVPLELFGVVVTGIASATVRYGHASTDLIASASPVDAGISIVGVTRVIGGSPSRIVNVRVYLKDVSGQPAIKVAFRTTDRANTFDENAVTATSAGSGAVQTLTLANVNHLSGVTSAGPVYISFRTLSSATGTYSIYAVEIDVDRL